MVVVSNIEASTVLLLLLLSARPIAGKSKTKFGPALVVDPHFKGLHYVDVDYEPKQTALSKYYWLNLNTI